MRRGTSEEKKHGGSFYLYLSCCAPTFGLSQLKARNVVAKGTATEKVTIMDTGVRPCRELCRFVRVTPCKKELKP